ncbi:hypothetical protein [Rhodoplanes sp. Z2-YC6860]|uniref:hypothetical protein n=1 Tax=Rhodoplanes sp. Z2-YC6860 TaxID=674703 RepID=UPI0008372A6D|nr:hypothetical protein [Rhodoplanes sp. Z2-YC6860]
MSATLILAVYGAILSTVLGFITVFNFLKERRILSVEAHPSFETELAHYDFVIANISSRPLTIIDCAIMNLAKTDEGGLQSDWGIEPYVLKSLFGNDKTKKLILPRTLHPGEILIVGTNSDQIIEQFSFYASTKIAAKTWTPTEAMQLEISHSMSKKLHKTVFKLEENELSRLTTSN